MAPSPTPNIFQASIVDVINRVDAHPLPDTEWEQAEADMAIYAGGEVWAKEQSTARISLDHELIRVAPNSIFTLQETQPGNVRLELDQGQVWIEVDDLPDDASFEVETSEAVASVRGTRFSVRTTPEGYTVLSTIDGQVLVSHANYTSETVPVAPWEQVTVFDDGLGELHDMQPYEYVYWGSAVGSQLDMVWPIGGCVYPVGYIGEPAYTCWSAGEIYVSITYFEDTPYGGEYYSYTGLFTPTTGSTMTQYCPWTLLPAAPILPPGAGSPACHHLWDKMLYTIPNYDAWVSQVCLAHADGSFADCWGGDAFYSYPTWIPDDPYMIVVSDEGSGSTSGNIYSAYVTGDEMTRLTTDGNNTAPAVSPDGGSVSYYHLSPEYAALGQLWVMSRDGSNPQKILDDIWVYTPAAWSPNGEWIAAPGYNGGVWLVHPDGSDAHLIPGTEGKEVWHIEWAPGGGYPLAVTVGEEDATEVWYVTEPSGEADFLVNGWGPTWAPDGSKVGFALRHADETNQEAEFYVFDAIPPWEE